MENLAVSIKNLSKTYGDFKAVDNLDFEVVKGECFGLLGPNGAGKTTSMKMIYGKSQPDSNESTKINVFGYDPAIDFLKIKSFAGVVPQHENLDLELNVKDNLYVYSKFYGMPKAVAISRIKELLKFMELEEKEKSNLRELSGGMLRRLTIARAMLNNPKLLILDEPTTGLDPQVRHLIWNKIRELRDNGVTILLTTHYMEEAFQICDRIIILDRGKKILSGRPRELLAENIEKYVVEVYGVCNKNDACVKIIEEQGIRYEFFKDSLFLFSNNHDKIVHFGETLGERDYHLRFSNLEDLFLKVTGRSINELQ